MKKLMLVASVAALLAASAFGQSRQGNLEQVLNSAGQDQRELQERAD